MRARTPLAADLPGGARALSPAAAGRGGGAAAVAPSAPRARLTTPAGRLALVGLLLTGLLITVSAADTQRLLPRSLRAASGFLAGAFGNVGLDIGLGGLIAALGLMFVFYAIVVRAARQLSRRAVLTSIAALNALVLLAPPLLSTDLFSYIAYGRLGALYGINPYLHGPNAISFDALYPLIGPQWTHTPTAYGPLFTALSYPLAGMDIAANVFAYKALAALSCLTIVVLVWHAARLRGLDPLKAVALVGLNPVIVIYGVGGGHNDLLMLAILIAGVYVLLRRRTGSGGGLIVAATAVKLTAGILLPFAIAAGAGRRVADSGRGRIVTGAAVAATILGGLGLALFGVGPLHLLGTLSQIQSGGGPHSVPGFLLAAAGLQRLEPAVSTLLHAAYAVGVLVLIRRVWVGEMDWIAAAGWAIVGLLVSAGLLMPWYIAWLIPLAALTADRRLWLAAICLTCIGLTSL